jgi:predicted O-methyltransferase YrrM
MESSRLTLARKLYHRYLRIRTPRFYALKEQTHGMLNPMSYKKIYGLVYRLPNLDLVEIGGAAGTASIAMALAMQESGKSARLIVIERCEGGSRTKYGGYRENLKIITDNFRKFSVEDTIILYPHEIALETRKEVLSLIKTPEIAAFMHDADGRLDRDFLIFWPLLRPGGLIIIDDYQEYGSYKHVLTYRLLNRMIRWKLFTPSFMMRSTIIGYKPANSDIRQLDVDVCLRIIRNCEQLLD